MPSSSALLEGFEFRFKLFLFHVFYHFAKLQIDWELGRNYLQNNLTEFYAGLWGIYQKMMWKLSTLNSQWQTPLYDTTPYHTNDVMWHHWCDVAPPPLHSWTLIYLIKFHSIILSVTCHGLGNFPPLIQIPSYLFVNFQQPTSYYFLS